MTNGELKTQNKVEISTNTIKRGRPTTEGESFPRDPLSKALKLAESIETNNAGKPFDRIILSKSIESTPNSSAFRQLITSSSRYGLTEGGHQAEKLSLTAIGSSIVAPLTDEGKSNALLQALTTPPVFKKFFEYYNNKQIPREELLKNSLKKEFNIASEYVDACYNILMHNIEDFNIFEDIKGSKYLKLSNLSTSEIRIDSQADIIPDNMANNDPIELPVTPEPQKIEEKTKRIFVAHGKNTKPLEQLKVILDQFNIPYRVAIDEANQGRPISQKVSDLMRECSSAIFLFTKDEETKDLEGNTVYRPSDNVVFELGAASVLYGNKIVIFKQDGVSFGSDFKDLGYISFDDDKLNAKAMDLMKELVGFGLLKVSAT